MNPKDLIPKPCHEDLDAMSGDQQRKFCDKCSTHVHDLTDYSTEEILALKVQNGGNLCGSFRLAKPLTIGAGIASLALASCQPKPVPLLGIICPPQVDQKADPGTTSTEVENIITEGSRPGSHAVTRDSLTVGLIAVPTENLPEPTILRGEIITEDHQ